MLPAILLAIGILIGIAIVYVLFLIDSLYRQTIHPQGILEHIRATTNEKGDILLPPNGETEDWLNELPTQL